MSDFHINTDNNNELDSPRPIRMANSTFFELREFAASLSKQHKKVITMGDAIQYLLNVHGSTNEYYANIH